MDLYRDFILDHYNHPHNFGTLKDADISQKMGNPFCGDQISVSIKFSRVKSIENINFEGTGCAISIASASLLTDYVKGKNVSEIMNLKKEKVLELLGITLTPTRLKCALLPLETIQSALNPLLKQ